MGSERGIRRLVRLAPPLVLAAGLVACAAAFAGPDVGGRAGVDTGFTPVAKPAPQKLWQWHGGARYGGPQASPEDVPEGSPTPFEADLLDVGFIDPRHGFAAGSLLQDGESVPAIYRYDEAEQADGAGAWTQVPLPGGPGYVAEVAWLGPGRALAVGGDGVYPHREPAAEQGGSRCSMDEPPPAGDIAGSARAWLYEQGEWRELRQLPDGQPGDELPDGMGGLTALDAWNGFRPNTRQHYEFAVAGGLCQLWHWESGGWLRTKDGSGFEEPYTHRSPAERVSHAQIRGGRFLRYRVRAIDFNELATEMGDEGLRGFGVLAVTSGCCGEDAGDPAEDPSTLTYIPDAEQPARGQWRATATANLTNAFNSLDGVTVLATGFGSRAGAEAIDPHTRDSVPAQREEYFLPESMTDVHAAQAENPGQPGSLLPYIRLVFTPAGPPPEPAGELEGGELEPSSVVAQDRNPTVGTTDTTTANLYGEGLARALTPEGYFQPGPLLAAVRLLDGDGGFRPDWLVGQHSRANQALVLAQDPTQVPPTAAAEDPPRPDVRGCGQQILGFEGISVTDPGASVTCSGGRVSPMVEELPGYNPGVSPDRLQSASSSYRFLSLDAYGLNAIDVLDSAGVGWAVGEHGAIWKLTIDLDAAAKGPGGDPQPPSLGRPQRDPSDRSAYDEHRADQPKPAGSVPPLASSERIEAGEPQPVFAGSPDVTSTAATAGTENVTKIVMSRDGSEGWAIGGGTTTLHHYEGGAWRRCDFAGIHGVLDPDPACASLAKIAGYQPDGRRKSGAALVDASRVPLERDSDPTNDDELEIVAIGASQTILRYSEGRWREEDADARAPISNAAGVGTLYDVSFAAPDEGWISAGISMGSWADHRRLYRFDGKRWIDCSVTEGAAGTSLDLRIRAAAKCGDADNLLYFQKNAEVPFVGAFFTGQTKLELDGLVSTGGRTFAYGLRRGEDGATYPMVIFHEDGRWRADPDGGGYDPGCAGRDPAGGCLAAEGSEEQRGYIEDFDVATRADGSLDGWAVGGFGIRDVQSPDRSSRALLNQATGFVPATRLLRLGEDGWQPESDDGPLGDLAPGDLEAQVAVSPSGDADGVFVSAKGGGGDVVLGLDPERGRMRLLEQARPKAFSDQSAPTGVVQALAPDGEGGAWVALANGRATGGARFQRYTSRPPRDVFSEVSHPVDPRRVITDLDAAPDGGIVLATDAGMLYRYDRVTDWEELRVFGWDPGVVTNPSEVNAVAAGPGGEGLAVGRGGRVAQLSAEGTVLDLASGNVCAAEAAAGPCGTAHDLLTVDVAPDGSAIAAGAGRSLLWRPPGGELRAIGAPPVRAKTRFVAASMPRPDRVWLLTDLGQVFRGEMGEPGAWSFSQEAFEVPGGELRLGRNARLLTPRALEIDAAGRGLLVGDAGLVIARSAGDEPSWERVDVGLTDNLTSVALPASGGEGALIGGQDGLILTLAEGEFQVARPPDWPGVTGPVVALALLGGTEPGDSEAWAAIPGLSTGANNAGNPDGSNILLHHSSDPAESLLDAGERIAPLPDAPSDREGELTVAALGKSDCGIPRSAICAAGAGTTEYHEVLMRRVVDEIRERAESGRPPIVALHTGDSVDSAGPPTGRALDSEGPTGGAGRGAATWVAGAFVFDASESPGDGVVKMRRWSETVVEPLADAGIPLFGAPGAQDLSEGLVCDTLTLGRGCVSTKQQAKAGDNLAWRAAMATQPQPWGSAEPAQTGSLRFEPAEVPGSAIRAGDVDVALPDEAGGRGAVDTAAGGASTHYAVDVVESGGDERRLARIVVVDTSLRSLSAGDAVQNPVEQDGQLGWLERAICVRGSVTDTGGCTREPGQRAIVVSSTPTYSYGPGALVETQADAGVFEATLMRHDVDLVVSGRLGWNALYYALAPNVHEPCPDGSYPARPPREQAPSCSPATPGGAAGEGAGLPAVDPLASAGGVGSTAGGLGEVLPFVVASSAGGKLGTSDEVPPGDADEGFWHGYTVVRVPADGDAAGVVVEQRPVYDWIGLDAPRQALAARSRLRLDGVGRSPIGTTVRKRPDIVGSRVLRLDRIHSAAVTHRYDLLLADPEQPWMPCRDGDPDCEQLSRNLAGDAGNDVNPCAPYVCLPRRIGTVDWITGDVRAGDGRYPSTFAVALLSVGEKAATYPLVFERSPSFVIQAARRGPALPVAARGGAPSPPPPPDPPPPPRVPQVSLPAIPTPPAIPPIDAAQPPEPMPPAPPAPPPPVEQPAALDLSVAPPGVSISTPTALIQPPTPPVNPAPPGGARKEARQRQAAAQKGGAEGDAGEGAEETQGGGGDLAGGRLGAPGAEMTRHDSAFTAYRPTPGGPSLGAAALYTSGFTLLAFTLAAGWRHGRPTPRRHHPDIAAPAFSRARTRSERR